MQGRERGKREAKGSPWVSSNVNNQGSLLTRLVLGSCKTRNSPHRPPESRKVYIEALAGLGQVYHPWAQNGCRCGNSGQTLSSTDRGGARSLSDCLSQSTCGHDLAHELSMTFYTSPLYKLWAVSEATSRLEEQNPHFPKCAKCGDWRGRLQNHLSVTERRTETKEI